MERKRLLWANGGESPFWGQTHAATNANSAAYKKLDPFLDNLAIAATATATKALPPSATAITDTDARVHFFMPEATVTNIDITAPTKVIGTASGELLKSTVSATMNLPGLPKGTETGHIMPTFTNNLVSIGIFCDAGCTVTFTAAKVKVHDFKETLILEGPQEQAGAKMWRFNLTRREASNSANYTVRTAQHPTLIPMDEDEQTREQDHVP